MGLNMELLILLDHTFYLCIFLSPIPTLVKIWRRKSVEEFKASLYLISLLNCAFWVVSSVVTLSTVKNEELNSGIHGRDVLGLILEIIYLVIYFVYAPIPKRKQVAIALVFEAVFFVIALTLIMLFLPLDQWRYPVNGLAALSFLLVCVAPFTVTSQVISTQSVKYMPFLPSLAIFFYGLMPMAFSLHMCDEYSHAFIPMLQNSLLAVFGLLQLILYARYYRSTQWDDADDENVDANRMEVGQC